MSELTARDASAPTAALAGKQTTPTKTKSEGNVTKRLQSELMSLMMANDCDCTAFPEGDNLFDWVGTIKGTNDTVYEGLTYRLSINFPPDYPYSAPTFKFVTPMFHPNVDQHGNICLDILKEKWSAAYSVKTILLSLQSLLDEPNNESPLNIQAANLWLNQSQYKKVLLAKWEESKKANPNAYV
ncbi:hypothetical protein ScalyP_jg9398 [Parmales sp. scaly parma]|nr:hypothetical protein ScalyP_jg9398 [Parmales sp. scaly parma]